jgi:hypothetical protein
MKLSVNTSATIKELVNEALAFSKHGNDVEAMEYLNEVLEELKWLMNSVSFSEFKNRINTLVSQSKEL